ncbi:MAG: hypothetical protein IJ664_00585 [Clostridia bacterium]|nr:hypothetical protein [Clostridia bacterium]
MKKLFSLVLALVMVLSVAAVANADEKTTLNTYEVQSNELTTWNIQYSQAAADLNVLVNCIDGLLTNDSAGNLKPNAAKSYESPDGGKTWIFTLNEGMTWVNKDGEVQADVVASDWVTGLEWVLNYAKNDSYNVSMPAEMVAGANDYYEFTKKLTEEQGEEAAKALTAEDDFASMVGIAADDEAGTVTYTLLDSLPYFPSVATYNCLYPISAELLEEVGVDGYRDITWEDLWYSGAYTITYFESQNQKVFTKNPNYWNKDAKIFDTVTCKMVESVAVAYQLFTQGELDHVNLEQANLQEIYADPTNAYNSYLVEKRPDKYSFQFHLVYAKNNEDGTPDVNWNTAVANENFRKSFYYGLDLTNYLARTNAINPLSCENFAYTMNGVAFAADGTDYADLVRAKLDIDYTKDGYKRYDPEKAAAYKAAAIEELTAKGVTFPVVMDIYVMGSDTVTAQSYTVLSYIISAGLGDDYLKLNIKTYVSSLANEVRKPRLASVYINGWGADFADPINFLGQETYNDTQAYYANNYSVCNDATDPDLIAAYEEFTALVEKAKVITDDMDARMAAFAEAEACMLDHALVIPCNYRVQWELTDINNYSKVYSMYGMQSLRYVDWQAFDELITTEQMASFAN